MELLLTESEEVGGGTKVVGFFFFLLRAGLSLQLKTPGIPVITFISLIGSLVDMLFAQFFEEIPWYTLLQDLTPVSSWL